MRVPDQTKLHNGYQLSWSALYWQYGNRPIRREASIADVDFVAGQLPPQPSSAPCSVLLHCPTTALARIVLDGAGARTLIS